MVNIYHLPRTLEGLPVIQAPPRRHIPPSEKPWHDFLAALRERARRHWEMVKARAARGDYDPEPKPKPQPAPRLAWDTSKPAVDAESRPEPRPEPVQPATSHGAARNAHCPCGSGRKFKQCCRGKAAAV